MLLEYSYGCTANSLSVNRTQEIYLDDRQRRRTISRIFAWYRHHPEALNSLLIHFLENHSDRCDMSEPCSQCGDTVTTYTKVI